MRVTKFVRRTPPLQPPRSSTVRSPALGIRWFIMTKCSPTKRWVVRIIIIIIRNFAVTATHVKY